MYCIWCAGYAATQYLQTTLMQSGRLASSPNSLTGKRLRHLSHPLYAILSR